MFHVGQKVLYGVHGVCSITAVETKSLGKEKKEFYCLELVEQPGTMFYVPTGNPVAVGKIRPLIRREEFEALVAAQKDREWVWIDDENQRKQYYRELMTKNDRGELIAAVGALYRYKRQLQETGRKFHACDEGFLRDATRLLSGEFALVLDISRNEVAQYMKDQLETK